MKWHWSKFSLSTWDSTAHSFYQMLHAHYRLSSRAGTIDQTVADKPSGLTSPQEKTNSVAGVCERTTRTEPTFADSGELHS
jgi:hypothetical protein